MKNWEQRLYIDGRHPAGTPRFYIWLSRSSYKWYTQDVIDHAEIIKSQIKVKKNNGFNKQNYSR